MPLCVLFVTGMRLGFPPSVGTRRSTAQRRGLTIPLHAQPATEIDLRRRSQEQRFLRDDPETNPSETAGLKLIGSRLKLNLYLMCGLTDFASFAMVFAVSRGLAEGRAAPWYLGLVGAGLSFSAAVGSVLGGWLASRFDGRMFLSPARALWC